MTDVLAAIDGALHDYETGADAMRWVPPDDREPEPEADLAAAARTVMLGIRVDVEPFMAAMRQMTEAVNRALRPWAELVRKLAPTAQVIHEARRARRSAMHAEYARRQRARRRRR
jgi:hypothetical protein